MQLWAPCEHRHVGDTPDGLAFCLECETWFDQHDNPIPLSFWNKNTVRERKKVRRRVYVQRARDDEEDEVVEGDGGVA